MTNVELENHFAKLAAAVARADSEVVEIDNLEEVRTVGPRTKSDIRTRAAATRLERISEIMGE